MTSEKPWFSAQASTLEIDPTAIEILSVVSGKKLMPAMRKVLLNTLEEFVEGQPSNGLDYGPFSQVDVFGAILGMAHFVLASGGSWIFVRVPELTGKDNKTSDIYAMSGNGKPWHLELKGSAPMSDDFKPNVPKDLCSDRLRHQVRKGLDQLKLTSTDVVPTGAPGVMVDSGRPYANYIVLGGKALSLVVLPDGELGRRTDIFPPQKNGCPRDDNNAPSIPCNVKCLTGLHVDKPTSIVGLLWQQPSGVDVKTKNGANDDWNGILTAAAGVQFAVWAGSTASADEALLSLANRLARTKRQRKYVGSDALLFSMLKQTRTVASMRARHAAINQLVGEDISSLSPDYTDEYRFGRTEEVPLLNFSQINNDPLGNDSDLEFQIESNGYRGFGRVRNGNITVVPSVDMIDRHSTEPTGRDNLLDLSVVALQSILSSEMGGSRTRNLFPSLISVNGMVDGTPWLVGYRTDNPREATRSFLPFNDYICVTWYHKALRDSYSRVTLYPLRQWFICFIASWSNHVGYDEKHMARLFERWLNVIGTLALKNPEDPLLIETPPWSMTPMSRLKPGGYRGWAAYDGRIQLSRIA